MSDFLTFDDLKSMPGRLVQIVGHVMPHDPKYPSLIGIGHWGGFDDNTEAFSLPDWVLMTPPAVRVISPLGPDPFTPVLGLREKPRIIEKRCTTLTELCLVEHACDVFGHGYVVTTVHVPGEFGAPTTYEYDVRVVIDGVARRDGWKQVDQ